MTWGEFKAAVEAEGVQDDDLMWYIDVTEGNPTVMIEPLKQGGRQFAVAD